MTFCWPDSYIQANPSKKGNWSLDQNWLNRKVKSLRCYNKKIFLLRRECTTQIIYKFLSFLLDLSVSTTYSKQMNLTRTPPSIQRVMFIILIGNHNNNDLDNSGIVYKWRGYIKINFSSYPDSYLKQNTIT